MSTHTAKQKPELSFWQIWNMSFGFLGIQFGFALQNANVSRIFETLGADMEQIPILWIAAPLTGLIVQPIIGYYSDRTWTKLGRRRPYFLVGAILASIALFIMPNSPVLWVAAGMLWIMDASINISMEPFRAFVGDNLPAKQRTMGFSMQSFFIGIGAVVASVLPWMLSNWFDVSSTAPDGSIPDTVKWSFYAGGIIFFLAVLWTVLKSKEYSPEELAAFEGNEHSDEYESDILEEERPRIGANQMRSGFIAALIGIGGIVGLTQTNLDKSLYILFAMILVGGILFILSGLFQRNGNYKSGFVTIMTDFQKMPKTMKQLAWVQFFSWFALFSMWIYTTSGVTRSMYDLSMSKTVVEELSQKLAVTNITDEEKVKKLEDIDKSLSEYLEDADVPIVADMKVANYFSGEEFQKELGLSSEATSTIKRIQDEYNKGADWVGVGFGVYNGAAAILAFFLIWLARKTNRKMTHAISLVVGGLSFISIFFISNPNLLLLAFVGIGLVWASILAMPYAILTGSIPSNKMGYYMGVFNFFIVIPQLVAATILGFLVTSLFGGEPIYALLVGGGSMLLAAILTLRVDDTE